MNNPPLTDCIRADLAVLMLLANGRSSLLIAHLLDVAQAAIDWRSDMPFKLDNVTALIEAVDKLKKEVNGE